MEQFYYEDTAVVENADADCHSLLKASALLRYVEQISTMHAQPAKRHPARPARVPTLKRLCRSHAAFVQAVTG